MAKKKPNILLIGIDSLLSTHMSCYGYDKLTTPHIDRFAQDATLFENAISPHIPTTSGYASMLTGRDCFGTQVVALRHKGPIGPDTQTLAEICGENGYETTCVGFKWNPASRGFHNYVEFPAWGEEGNPKMPKAENLNKVAMPEIDRLNAQDKPWMMLLRHMDPHTPYLPPEPYDRMFYHGDECDPNNKSMDPVYDFFPFADYFKNWLPGHITDKDWVIAQYDGAVAYMDACMQKIFTQLETLGILDDTIVVINSDHGETLYDHECWFDHHGLYDVTLRIPLIIRYPKKMPQGLRLSGYCQQKHLVPTLVELAALKSDAPFDGPSLMKMVKGKAPSFESGIYITECTWMRKHGWRTPEWKLIVALEPDLHGKPEVELYNLVEDPDENKNLAKKLPHIVDALRGEMDAFIAKREKETGLPAPILNQPYWHGHEEAPPYFTTTEEAYNTMHIGDAKAAAKLQAGKKKD